MCILKAQGGYLLYYFPLPLGSATGENVKLSIWDGVLHHYYIIMWAIVRRILNVLQNEPNSLFIKKRVSWLILALFVTICSLLDELLGYACLFDNSFLTFLSLLALSCFYYQFLNFIHQDFSWDFINGVSSCRCNHFILIFSCSSQ